MSGNQITPVITVRYEGKKAQDIAANCQQGLQILRDDLLCLKLPQPKRENTTFFHETTSSCGYVFFWPLVQEFGVSHFKSTFYDSLATHILLS